MRLGGGLREGETSSQGHKQGGVDTGQWGPRFVVACFIAHVVLQDACRQCLGKAGLVRQALWALVCAKTIGDDVGRLSMC